ncbi:Protein CBG25442 [Caenorhabditis briggsae]|uniref:Protein CBG25442 n=1 Tax=Caenorhabditis briggsae TaxID=6238 RepID=B6ILD5_CAEBR|nr:Protein CBG25442 [Caenorhabditis briggsae]CAS00715.1 Protein CBG25442 [Caenorhabditis briggsae]
MLAYLPDLFFFSSDGPQERWHMRRAVEEWDTNKRPDMAYHAIFQAANARLQKYFLAMGARIQHEKARDWAVNHLFDENVTNFLDGLDALATHELLKEDLLKALIESPLPENIGYVKETWEETYEGEKYTVNHHWNLFGTHREDPSLKMPKMG